HSTTAFRPLQLRKTLKYCPGLVDHYIPNKTSNRALTGGFWFDMREDEQRRRISVNAFCTDKQTPTLKKFCYSGHHGRQPHHHNFQNHNQSERTPPWP
ncbi:hypothetical protein Q4551_11050, partial [Oceanobacter sp. 5_MG-2023]|uniref:hypothetical protein n=1 Tax=Oceanobacter sp. 5_MG-2023 TaxID=3062645 RepID=UPI0026E30651